MTGCSGIDTTKGEFFRPCCICQRRKKQLAQYHFSAAQSYLVNLKYVKAVENDFVHVNTDHLISCRQRAAFLTAVASYIGGVL